MKAPHIKKRALPQPGCTKAAPILSVLWASERDGRAKNCTEPYEAASILTLRIGPMSGLIGRSNDRCLAQVNVSSRPKATVPAST